VESLRVAILGMGEAGSSFASDLSDHGADVRSWDPDPERMRTVASPSDAADGAHVVLSLNSAAAALEAARSVAGSLGAGRVYADLNTTAPRVKREIAAVVEPGGALFADVALMAPVPGRGLKTPALASGSGAAELARLLGPLGMPVEVVQGGAGAAAERKLLRSVFMKGLAAAALESVAAADAAGCGEWLRGELERELGAERLERLLEGSRAHAVRRVDEMEAARELLIELGDEPRVAGAALASLRDLAAEAVR
jgi:3-hydroxyisobutyrate dehydrogenase-like beta-hydroxyacid dehydrogenase